MTRALSWLLRARVDQSEGECLPGGGRSVWRRLFVWRWSNVPCHDDCQHTAPRYDWLWSPDIAHTHTTTITHLHTLAHTTSTRSPVNDSHTQEMEPGQDFWPGDPTRPDQNRWPGDPVTRFHLCQTHQHSTDDTSLYSLTTHRYMLSYVIAVRPSVRTIRPSVHKKFFLPISV